MNNADQIDYWNGEAGQKWVANSDLLDAMLAPYAKRILEAANLQSGERVIDIGCGTGALSMKAAAAVGDTGHVIGVDVSEPMVELARERAQVAGAPASFMATDASTYASDQPVDVMLSRFGVMFFEDPGKAFASMRGNLKPGGRMTFACWQSLAENDWARAPLEAALPFLKEPPEMPPPGTPGPFAFADKDRMTDFLERAGWRDVSVESWTCQMAMPGQNVAESAAFMMQMGPVARLLEAQELAPDPVRDALCAHMRQYADDNGQVRLKGAVWIVTAFA